MSRRSFLHSLAAGSYAAISYAALSSALPGCGLFSTKTAVSTSRSLRLENGFFFGHDLRAEDSVVYVLDLSGSMSGRTGSAAEQMGKDSAAEAGGSLISGITGSGVANEAADSVLSMDKKVELVKDHLIASLRGLPGGAKFDVILFSNGVQHLAPTLLTANAASTSLVSAFVSRLREGGSTSLMAAIMAGLDSEARDLLVLTDGLPTDSSPEDILTSVKQRNVGQGHRISTVGVGDDQAKDFLSRLATENGGKYTSYA
jgi:Mg-chelatase subunit ChlD